MKRTTQHTNFAISSDAYEILKNIRYTIVRTEKGIRHFMNSPHLFLFLGNLYGGTKYIKSILGLYNITALTDLIFKNDAAKEYKISTLENEGYNIENFKATTTNREFDIDVTSLITSTILFNYILNLIQQVCLIPANYNTVGFNIPYIKAYLNYLNYLNGTEQLDRTTYRREWLELIKKTKYHHYIDDKNFDMIEELLMNVDFSDPHISFGAICSIDKNNINDLVTYSITTDECFYLEPKEYINTSNEYNHTREYMTIGVFNGMLVPSVLSDVEIEIKYYKFPSFNI
jgi:hypothetical protein